MVEGALLVVIMMTVIVLGIVMVVVDLMVDVMIVSVEMTEVMIVDMTVEVVEEVMTAVGMTDQEEVENSVLQETLILVFMLLVSQMTVDGLI